MCQKPTQEKGIKRQNVSLNPFSAMETQTLKEHSRLLMVDLGNQPAVSAIKHESKKRFWSESRLHFSTT